MILNSDRTELDASLNDPRNSLFVLLGPLGSKAELVHSTMEAKMWQPWQKYFLVTDPTLLSDDEHTHWFDGEQAERYAVLGGKVSPKVVKDKGPVTDLLIDDETADYPVILKKFLKGDLKGAGA